MSTKIYNGYVIPKMDLIKLLAFCKETQKKMQKTKNKVLAKTIAELCTVKLDEALVHQKEKPKDVLTSVTIEVMDRVRNIKKTQSRDPEVDFESTASFFPMKDKTLVLLYTDQKELTSCWEKIPQVKDYHYQNQTDRPKKISQKDWNKREKDWEKVLLNQTPAVPSQNSFSFTFTDDSTILTKEEVFKNLPTLERRSNHWAKNLIFSEALKGVDEKSFWDTFYKTNDFLRTPEGIKQLENKIKEVEKVLPKTYELKDLIG